MGLNLLEEDKRIKKLEIDTLTIELHTINDKLKMNDGGNTLLNAKKVMLELRRDVLNGS